MSILLIIFLMVIFLATLLWVFEPRAFVFWFQKLCYPVNQQQTFIADMDHHFPQRQRIDSQFQTLQQECANLINTDTKVSDNVPKAHQVDEYNSDISFDKGPGWRTFYLKAYSGWFEENCKKCPATYELFRDMDNVLAVMFSIMEPGNKIPPHKGELHGFLRYQLPLIVPKSGECIIQVGKDQLQYKEGESFLFDDNIEHSVENNTDAYRAVLFLDVRKNASPLITWLDKLLMSMVVLSPKFKKANVYMS